MKPVTLTLLKKTRLSDTLAPAMWLFTFAAGEPVDFRPGQFFLARTGSPFEAYLQRPLFLSPASGDPARLEMAISAHHLTDRGLAWLFACPTGQRIEAFGPLGNGFSIPASAQNWLVAVDRSVIEWFLGLGLFTTRNSARVTLIFDSTRPLPQSLIHHLPPHVEVATALTDDHLRWPDTIIALGQRPFYKRLKSRLAEARLQLPAGLAHILLADAPLHVCGVGACGLCAVPTGDGLRLACLDGPVFDLAGIDTEGWPDD